MARLQINALWIACCLLMLPGVHLTSSRFVEPYDGDEMEKSAEKSADDAEGMDSPEESEETVDLPHNDVQDPADVEAIADVPARPSESSDMARPKSALVTLNQAVHASPAPAAPSFQVAAVDSKNAHAAAQSAMTAAKVANKVAKHSVHLANHASDALKNARSAVHQARVDTSGLSTDQKESLKAAEAKLKEASKRATYGKLQNAKYIKSDVQNKDLQKMEHKMDSVKSKHASDDELKAMRDEIKELRKELADKGINDPDINQDLNELEKDIDEMEAAEKKTGASKKSHDEMKAEIERLRAQIKAMDGAKQEGNQTQDTEAEEDKAVHYEPLKPPGAEHQSDAEQSQKAVPVESKGIDIDTEMPYGELEPFGREDTAQELTEASIQESDAMVDQVEKAEVAEEKRAVFRALTRLRGAAITSFDGVARSQTGNIDEYNKINQWRKTHPLHHLADEESDVAKWAFPENAD